MRQPLFHIKVRDLRNSKALTGVFPLVMDPFSKDDPLHRLLGRCRRIEPRPNFTQNVMRSIRSAPQQQGFWTALGTWFQFRPFTRRTAAVCAVAFAAAWIIVLNTPEPASRPMTASGPSSPITAPVPAATSAETEDALVASELDTMNQLSDLLAQQDISQLTDGEIAMLLY